MTSKTAPPWLDPAVSSYIEERTGQPDAVLTALIERTRAETGDAAGMQVSPGQGTLLTLFTRLVGATRALEIGTFTGYSSICIARGLGESGSLVCCDVSERYTAIARDAWAEAGLTELIDLRIAPALETLATLEPGFDLAFIDADKENYAGYFEGVLPLLRTGGLILVDNTLWSGDVVRPAEAGSNTAHIQAFNDLVAADERVESQILPISDGMTVIRKR